MESAKPQYQHFIPQFLLRNFSHKYVPPDKASGEKPKKRKKKNRMYPGDPVINSLCLSDQYRIDECLVRRVCGLENMYVDTTKPAKEQGNLEKKFGVLENKASCVYRKIATAYEEGQSAIYLKRSEKDILRKFIFLLTYRGEQYHRRYNSMQDYDEDDKALLQAYMTEHGFTKPISVWLHGLETIIDLDMDAEGSWKDNIKKSVYSPIAKTFVSHIDDMYMAICTPADCSQEFVVTDNCYSVIEGRTVSKYDESVDEHVPVHLHFHRFAPISPRLTIVLRNNQLLGANGVANLWDMQYQWPQNQIMNDPLYRSSRKSILEDLPIKKATATYTNCPSGILIQTEDDRMPFAMNDDFCFRIFKIPTRHVRIMNGLLIEHAFQGSRIIFNRKGAFLDLMEWYLTEQCEVGKNDSGKHEATHVAYIKELSDFMLREGRASKSKAKPGPNEHADPRQLHNENPAEARFLEEPRRDEIPAGFRFDAIYERLGGSMETFYEDRMMSIVMFEIWTRCVDLDWDSPHYEYLRTNNLHWLLDGFRRQSCARFWMFLKRFRLNQRLGTTPSREHEATYDMPFLEGCCKGPEDILACCFPVLQGRDLNEVMYMEFMENMKLINGPDRAVESTGHFSLFGDPCWRIPTPAKIERWPWNDEGVGNGNELNEALIALLSIHLDDAAPNNSPQRNQQPDGHEVEEVDMPGPGEAGQSSIYHEKRNETPTKDVEEVRPNDDRESRDVPDALKRAARSWFLDKQDNETPAITTKCEAPQPVDKQGAPETPNASQQVLPEQPQNETRRAPRPWDSNLQKMREAYRNVNTDSIIEMALAIGSSLLFASLSLWLLGSFTQSLSRLLHFAAWFFEGLAWLLDVCLPVVYTPAKYLFYLGFGLAYPSVNIWWAFHQNAPR
ncbi:hypothetical protein V8C44DRAFT_333984 [Trichoderma aethiopicum]